MPDILPQNEWRDYIRDEVYDDVTPLVVDRAERTVVDRYRQKRDRVGTVVPDIGSLDTSGTVELVGWAETSDGTPDPSAMDDGLLDALRDAIARLVEHRLTSADRDVQSETRGSRSKSYRGRGVPSRVYAPLRPYDDRTPFM